MLRLPTVSSLQRATACEGSVALPQLPEGPQSPAARRGTLIHQLIAAELRGWEKPDMGKHRVKVDIGALRDLIASRLPDVREVSCEVAYAFDGEKVTRLGENVGRAAYPAGVLCGSSDIEAVVDEHGLVADVKTGSFEVPPPEDNWQVASLSFMAMRARRLRKVTGGILKLERDGSWSPQFHTWTAAELELVGDRLAAKMKQWRDASQLADAGFDVETVPNAGCLFCRAACSNGGVYQRQMKAA